MRRILISSGGILIMFIVLGDLLINAYPVKTTVSASRTTINHPTPPTAPPAAPPPLPQSQPTPTTNPPAKPACWWRVDADATYDKVSNSIIKQTEAAVQSAQQSYQAGWSTYTQEATFINETYTNANESLDQAYKGYLQTLQGCPASFSPPYAYQMLPTSNQ